MKIILKDQNNHLTIEKGEMTMNVDELLDANGHVESERLEESYPNLTAGNIVGEFTQEAEFTYRPSAGSVDVKSGYKVDHGGRIMGIKGNTVAWNQRIPNMITGNWTAYIYGKITLTSISDGVATLTNNTDSSISGDNAMLCSMEPLQIDNSHKYFISFEALGSWDNCNIAYEMSVSEYVGSMGSANVWVHNKRIMYGKWTTTTPTIYIKPIIRFGGSAMPAGAFYKVKNVQIIDLTLIYGAGNEPTTPEAFEADYIAWFGKPLSYEDYDAGSLRPVKMSGIKTVGFNVWDEEWELGDFDTSTCVFSSGNRYIISKNYCPILPSTSYFKKANYSISTYGLFVVFYDSNKGLIGRDSSYSATITTPSNAAYFKIAIFVNAYDSLTYNHDICINLSHSGAKDGEYEEHWESVANVPVTSLTGKLLSDGEPTGNSVVVFPDGLKKAGTVYDEIVKRGSKTYAIKRVGSQSVTGAAGDTVTLTGCDTDATAVVCGIEIGTLSGGVLTLAAAATSVEVYFPLETPEEYLLDDFDLPVLYDVDDWGTEEAVAPTGVASVAPVLDLKYGLNAADTLRNLPRNYVMATMEQSLTDKQKAQARKNIGASFIGYATCSTIGLTQEKAVSMPGFTPDKNVLISVLFQYGFTSNEPTLNVNSTGAKPILLYGRALAPELVLPNTILIMSYDGTNYNVVSIETGGRKPFDKNCVDMGLSSGLLWAEKNIDVTQEDGFAVSVYQYECSFFSFGNTDGHNPISESAFDYDFGSSNDGPYASTPGAALTGDIPLSYDAAAVNCGAPWRMPTTEEFVELFDNCDFIDANGDVISGTNKLTTINSIVGIRLKSKNNDNVIFFPCSGHGYGTSWYDRGSYGRYWASSLHSSTNGRYLFFRSGGVNPQYNDSRFYGFSVRAVQ